MSGTRKSPAGWTIVLVLGAGVFAVSTAAILIRLAFAAEGGGSVGLSMVLASVRMVAASVVLLPVWRGVVKADAGRNAGWMAVAAGGCLAVHFGAWISSFAYTTIAASTTLVTTNPIWVALLAWWWFGEKPSRMTAGGIGVAVTGGVLIAVGDAGGVGGGSNPLLGDGLALMGAWAFSGYLLFSREAQRRGLAMWPSIAVTYAVAAVVLLPTPWLVGSGYGGWSGEVYLYGLLLAVGPQLFGHTTINWSVRWVSPSLVALAILLEPVLSSVLGYVVFGEAPGPMVFVGAVVLLAGVGTAVWGSRRPPRPPVEAAGM